MSANILPSKGGLAQHAPLRIETQRLIMQKPEISHAQGFARGMGDVSVSRNTASFPPFIPILSAEFWVYRARANFERGTAHAYIITPHDSDVVAGVMEIFTNSEGRKEIGYWIARNFWGQGYATEAGHAILDNLATPLGLTHIEGGVYDDNPGSCRVLEKLGFKHMGDAPPLFSISRGRADKGRIYMWTAP